MRKEVIEKREKRKERERRERREKGERIKCFSRQGRGESGRREEK